MEALATIPVEIQATFAGVLIVALVTILEILDLRRAIRNHKQKIQELSGSSKSSETQPANVKSRGASVRKKKYRLVPLFSLILQFIFGLTVLAVFSAWTYYLVLEGFISPAVFSGLAAVIGIVMPFVVWLTGKRKNKEMAQLLKEIASRPAAPAAAPEKAPVAPAPQLAGAELEETQWKPAAAKPVAKAQTVPESEPTVIAAPEPMAEKITETEAVKLIVPETQGKLLHEEWMPEDSMLRRHYLTHIQAQKQQPDLTRKQPYELPARPTDSMLRRHYDSLMASLQQSAPVRESAPTLRVEAAPLVQVEPAAAEAEVERKAAEVREFPVYEQLPQDSMLRRHYLTALRYRLESALPPRPTDSILMRHFDNWKNVQLDREIAKCMEGMIT
jgi:hypothetical protein